MAEHTTTKLPALRNADNFDDWKYQAVATLVYLQLYRPIAEGAPPRLENVRDDTATANLQRARTALIEKERQERAAGHHGGSASSDPLPSELLPAVEQQYRPEHLGEYNTRNANWLSTNRSH